METPLPCFFPEDNFIAEVRFQLQVTGRYTHAEVSPQVLHPCHVRQIAERKRKHRHPVLFHIHLEYALGDVHLRMGQMQGDAPFVLAFQIVGQDFTGFPLKQIDASVLFVYLHIVYPLIFARTQTDVSHLAHKGAILAEEFARSLPVDYQHVIVGHTDIPRFHQGLLPIFQADYL